MVIQEERWEWAMERPADVITALAVAREADRRVTLFAASAAGIQRSTDGGRSWKIHDTESSIALVTSLAPSLNFATDRTLFIGTAVGCFRSTDAGRTGQLVLSGGQVFAVAALPNLDLCPEATPSFRNVLFVGTEEDGVYRSNDGGETWSAVNAGLLDLTSLALAFSPEFASDHTGFLATASGIYRTRNGGKAWRGMDLPMEESAVQCLAVSPNFRIDGIILAGTEEDGLLRSSDAGTTWHQVEALCGLSVNDIAFSTDGRLIALATDKGVRVTRDGGTTWRQREELGPVLCLTFVPDDRGEVLVVGFLGTGVARLKKRGAEWILADDGITGDTHQGDQH